MVGGGIAGLIAAITCAEAGAPVQCSRPHDELGGRARSIDGPYRANLGPHVLYKDGAVLALARASAACCRRPRLAAAASAYAGRGSCGARRRSPSIPAVLRLRGRQAPADANSASWAARHTDERTARSLRGGRRLHLPPRPRRALGRVHLGAHRAAPCSPRRRRRATGRRLEHARRGPRTRARARRRIETGARVDSLPVAPVIVATELRRPRAAGRRLAALAQRPHGVPRSRRSRTAAATPSSSPISTRPGGSSATAPPTPRSRRTARSWSRRRCRSGRARTRTLARPASSACSSSPYPDRASGRLAPPAVMDGRTGALDLPGSTWRDRPAIDRGEGVLPGRRLVAAPGLLSEVAWASGVRASGSAVAAAAPSTTALRAA